MMRIDMPLQLAAGRWVAISKVALLLKPVILANSLAIAWWRMREIYD
jgi:hypothetical protein